ncbi:uncharacterized protein LOC114579423 [Dendrobium catenatum]|uniref:uncharacterized protein LOC114579423 n=1 Tax=Dendrobium catenatum TaxID=906689 RepID=UPI00109FD3D8|nr:uncharacterized protein LOC114579423 [Dendrobium catenatum]
MEDSKTLPELFIDENEELHIEDNLVESSNDGSVVIKKRRRMTFKEITDDQGTYNTHSDFAKVFIQHFNNLFNSAGSECLNIDTTLIPTGTVIPPHMISALTAPVTMDEIKDIVFSGKPNSAPGPDGFTLEFYRATWNVIHPQLCKAIISFFNTGFMPNQVKATAIALIPKHPHANNPNTSSSVPNLISPKHLTQFLENIFIEDLKLKVSLKCSSPGSWPVLLMYISLSALTVCLRVILTLLRGISADNCEVFHLMFADDLHVFGSATTANAHTLNSILKVFASVTGLNVNPQKSTILISKNCPLDVDICTILNIQQSLIPIKYLGLPIFYKKLKLKDFQPLLGKISKQLEGWKAKTLSLAGRIQYIKFTICNTIAYWIRGSIITKGVSKQINRLCARFTYFGSITQNKLFTVSWKNTCCPKQYGGLGIPSIDSLCHNYACSVIWRFLNTNSLLFSWWRAKYYSLWNYTSANNAQYWDLLCKKASCIKNCISFSVFPSSSLFVIWDPWCGGHSIADYLKTSNSIANYSSFFSWKVSNIILGDNWNLPQSFENNIISLIKAIPISQVENHFWFGKQNPVFADFSKQFFSNLSKVPWYKYVWYKHQALRYSVYVWLAFKDGLKTTDILAKRGINTSYKCCFCHDDMETISHLFFECRFTFDIAKYFLPWLNDLLMRPNLYQLYNSIFEQRILIHNRNYYLLSTSTIIYFLWRARNDRIFGGIVDSQTTVITKIRKAFTLKTIGWRNV